MINKKKLAFFSFLFFIVFTIVGDSYIYYLDGKVFESDYRYETDIKDRNLKEEYVQDLKKYSDEFNLRIYVATTEVTSKNSATYTVYASDENKDYIKNRILSTEDNAFFRSFISGERDIIFKDFEDITDIHETNYLVFGTKENVEKLRSATNDKYGMSKPYDNSYSNDAPLFLSAAWIFIFSIILIYSFFEVSNFKKEALIRYLNGTNMKQVVLPLVVSNSGTIACAAMIGMLFTSAITESYKFAYISFAAVVLLLLLSNSFYLLLFNLNVKKTFVRSSYTFGYKLFAFFVLSVISITSILILTFTFKTIHDATRTINQQKSWEQFFDYDNVVFFFKDYSETTNMETDEEYAGKFYNENLDTYNMHLSFDFANNGGISSSIGTAQDPIVYLNKYAKAEVKQLGLQPEEFKEDTYYLISRYTEEELSQMGIYDGTETDEISFLLHKNVESLEVITIQDSYSFLVHDINMDNLADNYKENPIIIVDTHSTLPSIDFNWFVFNSLVKFDKKSDFRSFIESIGYENEVFYQNNIEELYLKKKAEKVLILVINVILSIMMMILFNISLTSVLKMDFDSRAVEIAVDKIFGKTLMKRYKALFRLLIGAFFVGVCTAIAGKWVFQSFSFFYVVIASGLVFLNTGFILSLFIKKYEKISIPRILKGGM
ncbi:hypothetical protein [Bacillus sp. THAF10]|uniref:hypothetical protein n=1 Tax=Bacillus sp. THAF10 TaxID=2587848 RepID=UPI001267C45D|nr:hypothetical protein [Bacillus sp. THAF10]